MFARAGQQKAKRNAHSSNARARNGTAKRSLLPALDMPNSTNFNEELEAINKSLESPLPSMPTDAAVRQHIIDSIDDFILQLPLGTDAKAAQVEAAVSAKLLSLYLSNQQLKQRLAKWTAVAQELQEVVQQQQQELHQTRQQPQSLHQQQKSQQQYHTLAAPAVQPAPQAEAANAELRQQLQNATSRLQEVEAAMKQLMDQQAICAQSLGASLQSSQLLSDHDAANAALTEATKSATAAQQDAARLRHALLDAEIDTQRASTAAETAQRRATELEAELSKARSQISAAQCVAETERRKLSAAEAAAAVAHAQLLEAQAAATKAQLQVTKAQQLAEQKQAAAQLECSSCAEKAGQLIALQGELQGLKAGKSTLETALQDEQKYSKEATRRLEESRMDLERARAAVAQAEQQRDDLHVQLFGSSAWDHAGASAAAAAGSSVVEQYPMLGWSAMAGGVRAVSPGAGGYPSPARGSHSSSPVRQRRLLLQPPREGLVQHCSQLELHLQQQDTELHCLRDQLLELQLQLSDAQSAASIAQQELRETHSKLVVAESAAADSAATAAAVTKQCEQQKQQVLQLQQQMSHLHAAKSQLEKLEAQQRVLLGDLKEYMAATAAASAAQATAEARCDALQQQLQDLQLRHESAEKGWQQQEARLSDENAQLLKRVAAAESAAQSGLQQAAAHYQQQLEQLAASHTARIDALRGELAADASRRADTEGKIHASQFQHAQELAAAKADTQQHLAQQQALQQTIAAQQSQLSATAQKLSAAEAALAAAKTQAVVQVAAAVKEHERLQQQLLEIRGERLQLQEQLASLQRSTGSHQQIADQYTAAETEAAVLVDGLRQQLCEQQSQVLQLRQQIQQLQQEKAGLDAKVAEARAGRDAAAKQAATAGERLAAAVAGQESLRVQLEAAGLVPGRYSSPIGSPCKLQLADSSRTLTQLTRCLAETEAQLAEVTTELDQSQQDNVALAREIQRLRAELQGTKAQGKSCLSSAAQNTPVDWRVTDWGGSGDAGATGRRSSQSYGLQGAFHELLQLTERMKSLEQRLQQQARESSSNQVSYCSSRKSGGSLASRAAGDDSSSREAVQLSDAAAALGDLHHDLRRVSRDLQQQQDQRIEIDDAGRLTSKQEYDVQALTQQVASLETELQSAKLAAQDADMAAADLRCQLAAARSAAQDADVAVAELTSQLAAAQSAAHKLDVANADQRRQVEDLQVQLAAARSAFEVSNSTTDSLQKLLAEVTHMKDQLEAGRHQADDSRVAAATAAAAEASEAAAAAAGEAERMQELVSQLQLQLEGASASAEEAVRSRDQVSAELRYLQTQFEGVTAELHHKQKELQDQQAEISALKEELYSAEIAAVGSAQIEIQQIRDQLLQAQEAARSDLAAAQQQVLQLQSQLQQLQDELLKQQEAASLQEPTSTARKMQALLIQKDRDIQRLQQQIVQLSIDSRQESSYDEAHKLQRDGSQVLTATESSADLVIDAEHAASNAAAAGRQQQQEDIMDRIVRVNREAAALERSLRPSSNSRLSSRHGSAHGAAADAEVAASSAAAAGRQQQQEEAMDQPLAGRVQKEPAALERSLRPSSNSRLSSRHEAAHGAAADAELMSLRSSKSPLDEEQQQQSLTVRSLAHLERSLHMSQNNRRESSPEDSHGTAAAAAVQQQQPVAEGPVGLDPVHLQRSLRPNGSARSGSKTQLESAVSTAGISSSNAGLTADSSSQGKLGDQPAAAAIDNRQRLDRSPSKRAAAVAAAVGSSNTSRELSKLPSSSSKNASSPDADEMQVRAAMTAGSRLASFNFTAAAAVADDEAVESSAANKAAASEQPPTLKTAARLSRLESARAASRQTSSSSSRAAQLASGLVDGSVTGTPAGVAEYSSSDEDSDDGVGVFGGLSHNTSSSSRSVNGSSSASMITAIDDLRDPGKPVPIRTIRKSSSAKYAGLDAEAAGIGSLTSAIGSNVRPPSSSVNGSTPDDRKVSAAVSADSAGSIDMSSGASRAKLLADSLAFGRGYDADKLRRSLSAGHRHTQQQSPQPPQQQKDNQAITRDNNVNGPGGSLRLRVMSASGALEGAASRGTSNSGMAAASNYRFSGGPALKPALSTSRAARIVGVMRSVSFKEPGRQ